MKDWTGLGTVPDCEINALIKQRLKFSKDSTFYGKVYTEPHTCSGQLTLQIYIAYLVSTKADESCSTMPKTEKKLNTYIYIHTLLIQTHDQRECSSYCQMYQIRDEITLISITVKNESFCPNKCDFVGVNINYDTQSHACLAVQYFVTSQLPWFILWHIFSIV